MQRAQELRKFLLDNLISYQEVNVTHFKIYDPKHELVAEVWPLGGYGDWIIDGDRTRHTTTVIEKMLLTLYISAKADKNVLRRDFESFKNQIQVARKLITVTELPSGALETQINDSALQQKYQYILDTYDNEMRLKTNPEIRILDFIIV